MRTNDADNVRLTAEARRRALDVLLLKERKLDLGTELARLQAYAARFAEVKKGPKYRDEIWALKQAVYLTEIEYRAALDRLNTVKANLRRRLMLSDAELSKLVDP